MMMLPMVITDMESDADRNLMADIYQRHRALMYKIARKYMNQESDEDDVVSDSCVALIRHIDDLRSLEEKPLRSYIAETTRRKAIDLYRKKKKEREKSMTIDPGDLDSYEERIPFDRKIALQNEIDMVKETLKALPEKEYTALQMRFFEGRETSEIAKMLGISANAVYQYIMNGRNHLKTALYEGGVSE